MKNEVLLFITDIYPETSGQAVISNNIYEILKNRIKIIHVPLSYMNISTKGNLLFKISFILRLIIGISSLIFAKSKKKIIYFTPSRGRVSIYRDLIILVFLKIIKFNKNIKIFSHLHGADMKKSFENFFLKNYFLKSYINLNISVIVLSNMHKKFALGSEYKNYITIPNFIRDNSISNYLEIINNRAKKHQKKNTKYEFLHLSGVLKNKGLDFAIRFILALNESEYFNSNKIIFYIKVVGWNKLDAFKIHPEIIPLINKLESKKLIRFYGPIYKEYELNEIFSTTHFNLLLSKSEAQPLSLIEAANFGCISIVNKTDFIEEMLLTIDGLSIDRDKLIEGLRKFINYFENIDKTYFSFNQCNIRSKKINNFYSFEKFRSSIKSILN